MTVEDREHALQLASNVDRDGMVLDLVAGLPTGGWIVADVSHSDADASTQLTQYEGTAPGARWPA